MKRRLTALLLTLALAFSLATPAMAVSIRDFTDVPANAWYYDELSYALNRGLVNGSGSSFNPNGKMTRAQFVTVLGRMVGVSANGSTATPFTDVPRSEYYAPYVAWASANGVVNGTSATTFSPNSTVTREQMAVILANYMKSQGITLPNNPSVNSFRDAWKISSWAYDAVNTLRLAGLLAGDSSGNCNPQNGLSRVEGTSVLVRLDKKLPTGPAVAVTSVKVDPYALVMKVGESTQLTAVISPSNATDKTVSWRSSNAAIVAVDASGRITAKSTGVATIYATAANGKNGICTISVQDSAVPVERITLSPSSLSLTQWETAQITATVYPANATDKTVTYQSSNIFVATVNPSGTVVATGEGTATITATSSNGKTARLTVTVSEAAKDEVPVTKVTVNPSSMTLTVGESMAISGTVSPSNATDKSMTGYSNNTAVATLSNGRVYAVAPGSATIVVTASNGVTGYCYVTVRATSTASVPVTGVTVNPSTMTLLVGSAANLTATVSPANATDKTLTYRSDDPSVASVSASGRITAVSPGKAVIYVSASNNKTSACIVTVVKGAPTPAEAYAAMIAMKSKYPEGMRWTNDNEYTWTAIPGVIMHGYGCAGFAFILSDAIFGTGTSPFPAKQVSPVRFANVREGDVLRVNNNTHSVIVLQKTGTGAIIAEGNFNESIHWGRFMSIAEVEQSDYMYTRYPN